APSRARIVAIPRGAVNRVPGYHFPLYAGRSSRVLVDSGRPGPNPPGAGSDGGGERPGLPPPGPPLRRRPGLLGDGELRRARAPQRADSGGPAGRPGRAPAGDPDLRLGAWE